MRLDSIQIGTPQPTAAGGLPTTGIYKNPVDRVSVTAEGLVGDSVVNTKHHGGVDQAVYIYTRDDYSHWESELGRSLGGGTFGENLTISGIGSAEVNVGDRFVIGGSVVIEATATRIPCGTFQEKMDEPGWVKRFRDARRPGFYARVIKAGEVLVNDSIARQPAVGTVSILETQDLYYDREVGVDRLTAALASPLAIRVRSHTQTQLDRLQS